ncbi:hypothetical protein NAEGRDRAFT_56417 [Naegleria gruberi]|uniref:Spt20-like SEP domain-containing protein n=1 Tax=Naegleria gruberi TaxID=5762 RepID=D2UXH1_NAEGR|nr:uncharacterized protein NAEGRDRAFT_56417 [Naegleria gruberi]EFC50284.1 hypothetical protein NAEGRDRAFT_56417 [Naegleria gruberi]|eukprot:XP_002683028.1 hypothetical protein NAEGRDRAFT_56417 [Naegleria gruberi strain NEG-M]
MAPKKKKSTSDKPAKESKKKKKSESSSSETTNTTVDTTNSNKIQETVPDAQIILQEADQQVLQQEPTKVVSTEHEETKKRKTSPNTSDEALQQQEPQRKKFQISLKTLGSRNYRFTPLSSDNSSTSSLTNTEKGEKCKNTCYMCQIHRQRSGEPEPIPYVDRSEQLTTSYMEGLCKLHGGGLKFKETTHKSLSDLCTNTILEANQDILSGSNIDEIFRFEKKIDILTGLPPSVVIKLFPVHFILEVMDNSQINSSQSKSLKYTEMTKLFLSQISKCKLVPDLFSEFKDLNCNFYDGSVIVHIIDMRGPENPSKMYPLQEIVLRSEPTTLEKDIYEFIDDNSSSNLSVEQRLEIVKSIVHTVKNDLSIIRKTNSICLDPNPKVSLVANSIHYNKLKAEFRRRRRPIVHFTQKHKSLSNNQSMEGLSATGGAPKQEHNLLNFIAKSKTWSESLISRKDKATLLHLPNSSIAGKKKKQKLSSKQKKSKDNETFPRNISSESIPAEYAKIVETILVNCKPPNRCRILKFESYDKTKTWRVDILPYLENSGTDNTKKFEAYILPPHTFTPNNQPVFSHEQPSSCIVGGRHAAELYARRLKDMFTSNGKTKLVMDHEIDLQTYITDNRLTKPPHLLQRLSKLGSSLHKPAAQTPVTNGQPPTVVNPNVSTQPTTVPTPSQYPQAGTSQQATMAYTNVNPQMNPRSATDNILIKKMLSSIPQRGTPVAPINPTTVNPINPTAQVATGNPIQQVFYQQVQTGIATTALHYLNSVINPQQVPQRANYGINYVLPNSTPFLAANRQPNSGNPNPNNIIINPNQPTQNKQ